MYAGAILLSLLAVPLTLASPTGETTPKICKKTYNAAFDNLATSPVTPLNNIPVPYDALKYAGFRVASGGLVSTIKPHSSPNSIEFSVITGATSGSPAFTKTYPGSPIIDFTMKSLYMGCVTINPSGVYLPSACTIKATGTKINGAQVFSTLHFAAPLLPGTGTITGSKTPQQGQNFPASFCNLSNVTFAVTSAAVNTELTAVSFDNVIYDAFYKCQDCKDGCSPV